MAEHVHIYFVTVTENSHFKFVVLAVPRGQENKLIQSSFFHLGKITPLVPAYKINIPDLRKEQSKTVPGLNRGTHLSPNGIQDSKAIEKM